jgi:hypothetical protein
MVGMAKQKLTPKQNRQQAEILEQTAIKLIEKSVEMKRGKSPPGRKKKTPKRDAA